MPSYIFESTHMPDEAVDLANSRRRVARINYWKRFGEDRPGWLVGVGRIEGNRFVLEEEFIAYELVVESKTYGFIGFQKREGEEEVDRGWIITFFNKIQFDGQRCVIT
ncbi:MAG: hypothetical protein NZ919_01245 [Candidatus Caldarchaeum sp.]|nr:hypothetical protein [Candidatus Caldarchaeum sp.]